MTDSNDPLALVGVTLDRRFVFFRFVTTAGQSYLYQAHDHHTEGDVAVKIFRSPEARLKEQKALRDRVFREATFLGSLRHPNLATFVAVGTVAVHGQELPYLVTRWIPGSTLQEDLDARVGRSSGRSPAEVLALLRGAFHALAHMHASGLVHGDVKPSNIMLAPVEGGGVESVLLDLGITCSLRAYAGSPTTMPIFSPYYAPPEAYDRVALTPAGDVYSLGCVCIEALVDGHIHDDEDTVEDCARRTIRGEIPTPTAFGRDVGAVEDVIRKAIALDPGARFADAGEFLRTMESAVLATTRDAQAPYHWLTDERPAFEVSHARTDETAHALWLHVGVALAAAITLCVVAVASASARDGGSRGAAFVSVEARVPPEVIESARESARRAQGRVAVAPAAPARTSAPAVHK